MSQDLRIFISYSKSESSRVANDLYLHLHDRLGYYVFLDKEEISGGVDWRNKITKEIQDCDIFIILITPGAIKSKFINDVEIPEAKKRSAKRYLHIIQCLHAESVSEKDAKKWNLSDKQMIYYKDIELESLRNSINKSVQEFKENSEDYAKLEKAKATRKKIKIASIPVAGFFLALYLLFFMFPPNVNYPYDISHPLSFGEHGMPGGKFNFPTTIAVDKNNNNTIYVVDTGNNRIQKFTEFGNFISMWDFDSDSNIINNNNNNNIDVLNTDIDNKKSKNKSEKEKGKYSYPYDIEIDESHGNVFVVDSNNNIIKLFSNNGDLISSNWLSLSQNHNKVKENDNKNNLSNNQNNDNYISNKAAAFKTLVSLTVDSSNSTKKTLFLVDRDSNKIVKLDNNANNLYLNLFDPKDSNKTVTFSSPNSAKVDSEGNLFVVDTNNHRIEKFDKTGALVEKWGSFGLLREQFNFPQDIAIDSEDNLYIVDSGNSKIKKFDNDGKFILEWGNEDTSLGNFNFPQGISIDSHDKIYVVDTNNHRVQKFDKFGNFITEWGSKETLYQNTSKIKKASHVVFDSKNNRYLLDSENSIIQKSSPDGNFILSWGKLGVGIGEFQLPQGIAIDSRDRIYIVDSGNSRIQVFDKNGISIREFGSEGSSNGKFSHPQDIDIDSHDNIYIADTNNHRIQKFDTNSKYLAKFGILGNKPGEFYSPTGIEVDSLDRIYVVDSENSRIQVLEVDKNGTFNVTKIIGSYGTFIGNFISPKKIALDSKDNILVLDEGNKRIQKIDRNGSPFLPLSFFANDIQNAGPDELINPTDISVDREDNVYIIDSGKKENFVRYDKKGEYFPSYGINFNITKFDDISAILSDSNDDLYVVDKSDSRIQKLDSNNNFIKTVWNEPQQILNANSDGSDIFYIDENYGNGSIFIEDNTNHVVLQFDKISERYVKEIIFYDFSYFILDSKANMYFTDTIKDKLYKADSNGTYIPSWEINGLPAGSNHDFYPLGIDSYDNIYFTDHNDESDKLYKVDSNGTYIPSWEINGLSPGSEPEFYDVDIDSLDNIYSYYYDDDDKLDKLYKFDSNGTYIPSWEINGLPAGSDPEFSDLSIDSHDNLYFQDKYNDSPYFENYNYDKLYKVDSNGTYIPSWEINGLSPGSEPDLSTLNVDSHDDLYFADDNYDKLYKVDSNGTYIPSWDVNGLPPGSYPEFSNLIVDSHDNLFFSDINNYDKLYKVDSNGTYIPSWEINGLPFNFYNAIFTLNVDSHNNSYFVDYDNDKLYKVDSNGTYIPSWDVNGLPPGSYPEFSNLIVDSHDNLFFSDINNNDKLYKVDSNGTYIPSWEINDLPPGSDPDFSPLSIDSHDNIYFTDGNNDNDKLYKVDSNGTYIPSFVGGLPADSDTTSFATLKVDSHDNIYFANNDKLYKFDSNGTYIPSWEVNGLPPGSDPYFSPLSIDSHDNIYFTDGNNDNDKLYKFDSNGTYIPSWDVNGLPSPYSTIYYFTVSADSHGNLYLVDENYDKLYKVDSNGTYIPSFAGDSADFEPGFFTLNVDSHDNLFVGDANTKKLYKFDSNGTYIPSWEINGLPPGSNPRFQSFEIDSHDNIYFPEDNNDYDVDNSGDDDDKLYKVDSNGTYIPSWEVNGLPAGSDPYFEFFNIDSHDNIYFTDGYDKLYKVDSNGTFFGTKYIHINSTDLKFPITVATNDIGDIYAVSSEGPTLQKLDQNLKFLFQFGKYGMNPGEFQIPENLAVDANKNIYIVDSQSGKIQKFDHNGYYHTSWGSPGKGIGQFISPMGITIDDFSNIFVADSGNHRIQKFDMKGNFLISFGGYGNELGEFNEPIDVYYQSNYIYVLDSGNHRIQKFDIDGNYQTTWGSEGNGEGEFSSPLDISGDPNNNTIYVLDSGNNRIQKFSENGNFIESLGSKGTKPGQFNTPTSLTIDNNSGMLIVDSGNQRVQKLNGSDFSSIRIWEPNNLGILTEKMENKDSDDLKTSSFNNHTTNLNFPQGIAIVDSNSEKVNPSSIFVSDTKNHRIMKFYNNETFISSWGSFGSGPGEFSSPKGLTVDTRNKDTKNNYIYVADTGNNRIQKFTLDGRYLSMSNKLVSEPPPSEIDRQELDSPSSLSIDTNGNIYVADTNHHRVVKVSPTSNNITKWGFFGNGPGEFSSPRGISVEQEGKYIYVADTGNDRIQKFDKDGNFVLQWNSFQDDKDNKKDSNSLDYPTSVDLDKENNVYVTDTNNHRVLKFTSNGKLLKDTKEMGLDHSSIISNQLSLSSPQSVAVDTEGNMYIADTNNHKIQVIKAKNDCKGGFDKILNIFECFGQFYKD